VLYLSTTKDVVWRPTRITDYNEAFDISTFKVMGKSNASTIRDFDGRLYSCGCGMHGRSGHGNDEDLEVPKLIFALKELIILQVSGWSNRGISHTLFLTAEGDVYGCGDNAFGQAIGRVKANNAPDHIILAVERMTGQPRMGAVECGNQFSVSLSVTRDVIYAWGDNIVGELGIGHKGKHVSVFGISSRKRCHPSSKRTRQGQRNLTFITVVMEVFLFYISTSFAAL